MQKLWIHILQPGISSLAFILSPWVLETKWIFIVCISALWQLLNFLHYRDSVSSEHLALSASKDGSDRTKVENLDQAMAEIERLRKDGEKLQGELTGNQKVC